MNKEEAKDVLNNRLKSLESISYKDLTDWIACKKVEVYEDEGKSGAKYQIEIEAFYDDQTKEVIRVLASIDDGGLLSAFSPITSDFLKFKDGRVEAFPV